MIRRRRSIPAARSGRARRCSPPIANGWRRWRPGARKGSGRRRGGRASMASSPAVRFVPPHPPRGEGPVAVWRGFFGERARTAVYGWSERAFEIGYLKRNILGFTVHILLDPDLIEHVLLGNAANYAKPNIVKSLLDPIIGRGLLTADAEA